MNVLIASNSLNGRAGVQSTVRNLTQALQAAALRPARLFLVQHSDDPAALLPHSPLWACTFQASNSSDLNLTARAFSRTQGLDAELLPLTAPNPDPRPHGFLRCGRLTSTTSGREEKISMLRLQLPGDRGPPGSRRR